MVTKMKKDRDDREKDRQFIKSFLLRSAGLLLGCLAIVVICDPFFLYHRPLPGLKAVLTEKEYQVIGSLRTLDYDSVIVGSSVVENINDAWFEQGFDCTALKAVRAHGVTADLCYLLAIAFAEQPLKYVFYNCDTSSLDAEPVDTYETAGAPTYLYDQTYLNDAQYLLNKDVLMEKIPFLIAQSLIGDYDENASYNWAQWKSFSQELALANYRRKPSVVPMLAPTAYQEQLTANLELLTTQISRHPETIFKIFFPPYSLLYWDNIYRNGKTEAYLYNMEQAIATLLTYDNVEIYYFQHEETIVGDLNNYMDVLHFSQEINYWMYEQMAAGNYRLTADNYQAALMKMRQLADRIVQEEVLLLEPLMQYAPDDRSSDLF